MTSLLKQLQDISLSRIKNTLFLTFILAWMTVNYDFVLTLLFSDIKIEEKINFIKSFPYSLNKSFLYPAGITLFYQLALPLLNLGLTIVKDKMVDHRITNHKNKTLKKHYEDKKDVEKVRVEHENIAREYELKLKKDELKTEKELVDIEEFKEYQKFKRESEYPIGKEAQKTVNSVPDETIELSEESKKLLIEASKDEHGQIFNTSSINGSSEIETNNKNFLTSANPQEVAKWKGVIQELENLNLIEDKSGKKRSYKVTVKGYKLARNIENETLDDK